MNNKTLSRYGIKHEKGTWFYAKIHDTRKPSLTLKHLNRLKKMRAIKKLEILRRQDLLQVMYGAPSEDGGDDLGF